MSAPSKGCATGNHGRMSNKCPHCQKAASKQYGGVGSMLCVGCCARLVLSARPSRRHQEAMFAAIARFSGSPSREEILACLARML